LGPGEFLEKGRPKGVERGEKDKWTNAISKGVKGRWPYGKKRACPGTGHQYSQGAEAKNYPLGEMIGGKVSPLPKF